MGKVKLFLFLLLATLVFLIPRIASASTITRISQYSQNQSLYIRWPNYPEARWTPSYDLLDDGTWRQGNYFDGIWIKPLSYGGWTLGGRNPGTRWMDWHLHNKTPGVGQGNWDPRWTPRLFGAKVADYGNEYDCNRWDNCVSGGDTSIIRNEFNLSADQINHATSISFTAHADDFEAVYLNGVKIKTCPASGETCSKVITDDNTVRDLLRRGQNALAFQVTNKSFWAKRGNAIGRNVNGATLYYNFKLNINDNYRKAIIEGYTTGNSPYAVDFTSTAADFQDKTTPFSKEYSTASNALTSAQTITAKTGSYIVDHIEISCQTDQGAAAACPSSPAPNGIQFSVPNYSIATIKIYVRPTSGSPSCTATPTSGEAPLAVEFRASYFDAGTNYSWSFGDGSTGNTTIPTIKKLWKSAGTWTPNRVTGLVGGSSRTVSCPDVNATVPKSGPQKEVAP